MDAGIGYPNFSLPYRFRYKPLDAETDEIRLLRLKRGSGDDCIACEILHASMSNTEFKALSYTWGDTATICWIRVDGCSLRCTSNLHTALLHLRSTTEDLILWVDAICIDQQNLEEQSQQVQKMRNIYGKAVMVLVWLGPSAQDSRDALPLLRDLNEHRDDHSWIESKVKDPKALWQFYALCDFFNRDYWHRIWVVQEIESARSILVLCGSESIEWQMLVEVQTMLHEPYYDGLFANMFTTHPAIRGYLWWWGPHALRPTYGDDDTVPPDLYTMLLKHTMKLATNPRDKIYALVGISSVRNTFPIDYSSPVGKVYTNLVVSLVFSSQSLDIICVLQKLSSNEYGLPSWVPDWSMKNVYVEDFFNSHTMSAYRVSASDSTQAEVKFTVEGVMFARGQYIDTMKGLGKACNMVTADDFAPASRAFHHWWALWKSLMGTSDVSLVTFVRTLLCNRIGPNGLIDSDQVEWSRWILGSFSALSMRSGHEVDLDATLRDLMDDDYWSQDQSQETISIQMRWISDIAACMMNRRFFVSSSGIAGLAPSQSEGGDKICILYGCSVPVILRPVDGHHILVGAAYVDGYMTGAGLVETETQEFEIH